MRPPSVSPDAPGNCLTLWGPFSAFFVFPLWLSPFGKSPQTLTHVVSLGHYGARFPLFFVFPLSPLENLPSPTRQVFDTVEVRLPRFLVFPTSPPGKSPQTQPTNVGHYGESTEIRGARFSPLFVFRPMSAPLNLRNEIIPRPTRQVTESRERGALLSGF